MFVSVSPFLYHVTASAVTISSGTQAEKPFVNTSYISKVSSNSCCETGSLSALMTASAIQHSGLLSRFGWHHRSTTGTLVRVGFTPGKIIPSSRTYLLWRSTFHFLLGTWLEIANDLYILPFSWSFVLLWQVHVGFWSFRACLGAEAQGCVAQPCMSDCTVCASAAPALENRMGLQAREQRNNLISTWFTGAHCVKEHVVCFKCRFSQFTKLLFSSSSYVFIQYCCCIWWPMLSSHAMQCYLTVCKAYLSVQFNFHLYFSKC